MYFDDKFEIMIVMTTMTTVKGFRPWTPASTGMSNRDLAWPQFRRNCRLQTRKGFGGGNPESRFLYSLLSFLVHTQFPNSNTGMAVRPLSWPGHREASDWPQLMLQIMDQCIKLHRTEIHAPCGLFKAAVRLAPARVSASNLLGGGPESLWFVFGKSGTPFQCHVIKLCSAIKPGALAIPSDADTISRWLNPWNCTSLERILATLTLFRVASHHPPQPSTILHDELPSIP